MSIICQAWVYAHSDSKGNDRLCLLAVADEADDDGTQAFPQLRTIAHKARTSVTTARRCVESLEKAGEVLVKRPAKTGRGHHNEYVVLMGRDPGTVAVMVGWDPPVVEKGSQPGTLSEPAGADGNVPERATQGGAFEADKRAETRQNVPPLGGTNPLTPIPEEHLDPLGEPPRAPRPRNAIWDALAATFGDPVTDGERAHFGKVCRLLVAAGATAAQVAVRARRARELWPDSTVGAVEKNWTMLEHARHRPQPNGHRHDAPEWDRTEPAGVVEP